MTNTPVYLDLASQVVNVPTTFLNANGVAVDPATVSLIVTAPDGTATTYTYVPLGSGNNVIIKSSTGNYYINLTPFNPGPAPAGLWNWNFIGAGGSVVNGCEINSGSFRVFSASSNAAVNSAYCSVMEVKSTLGASGMDPNDPKDDFEIQRAVLSATSLLTDMCGQHFYRITEARTFSNADSIAYLFTDPFVPGSITGFQLDYDGDGTFEVNWTENVNYQAMRYAERYNTKALGEERPHNFIQVIMAGGASGNFMPFLWPWTHRDRVKITATWGWKQVPHNIGMAALLLAVDLYKTKDAPWGIAGTSDLGMVRVQSNPQIMDLINNYVNPRNVVGI